MIESREGHGLLVLHWSGGARDVAACTRLPQKRVGVLSVGTVTAVLVDGHVHLYPEFDPARFVSRRGDQSCRRSPRGGHRT